MAVGAGFRVLLAQRRREWSTGGMTHDLVIRAGTVIDGTGTTERVADVGISGDRIAEIAEPATLRGLRTIDADGLVVTPGFVDIHTHYDAQIGWDPLVSSSCWHGVTSIVMGNCGMTFAPCRPDDRAYLADCMESVEDIPARSILDGLAWDWQTYGEYLGSLDRHDKGINVGGMVGHSALRFWAMGDRSLDGDETPTDDELAEMAGLVEEAMEAGALGFSTSRTLRHFAPDGRNVPGTFADTRELGALVDVLSRQGRGVVECAPRFDGDGPSEPRARSELAWMAELAARSGRPFSFNLTHTWANPEHHRLVLSLVHAARADGAALSPQTTSRGIGVLFSLDSSTPFDRHPSWQRLRDLDPAGRRAALGDPVVRAELVADAATEPTADQLGEFYVTGVDEPHVRYDCDPATELPTAARAAGIPMAEYYIDCLLASDGNATVYWPILNPNLDAVAEMLLDDAIILGLADGGAHVGQILDASQPTWFLSYWVRERSLMSRARGVRRLTADGARLFGLEGRGVIEPGAYADVNVIDWDALALPRPTFAHDFPLGAGRFTQRGEGYVATVVNGQVLMEDGEHSGALPGAVLRPEREL
ncbi:MAG TPA: amidohydrolase family protein [Acidimicrobiia bacterium]|nr:amidohydrolase family protein [Acidimicrobiia bacterium]